MKESQKGMQNDSAEVDDEMLRMVLAQSAYDAYSHPQSKWNT